MANVTVGAFTATYLEASERVPYGYEGEPRFGLTARTWTIRAVLTVAEETALLNAYNGWRDARITDEDTATSRVVGTTIAFTLTGTVGQPVTALPCWFAQAPSSAPAGPWRLVTWTMVDAAQALAVLLKQQENTTGRDEPDLGTLTLGSAVLTLTSPMENLRRLARTAVAGNRQSLPERGSWLHEGSAGSGLLRCLKLGQPADVV
jgi:hypothetical protein